MRSHPLIKVSLVFHPLNTSKEYKSPTQNSALLLMCDHVDSFVMLVLFLILSFLNNFY